MENIDAQEIWKPIEGYNEYEVSSFGKIRSYYTKTGIKKSWIVSYNTEPHFLKPAFSYDGYHLVSIGCKNKKRTMSLHRLVAKAFIPNPENKPQVNHKDGNKINNRADNLEWATKSENELHAYKTGLKIQPRGQKNHNSKLTDKQVKEIKEISKNSVLTQEEISKKYNISRGTIAKIQVNISWKHI